MTDDQQDDRDLRTLLHGAVGDVQPTLGLDEIRERTGAAAPPRRRWAPLVVGVAAAVAVVTGGTAWLAQEVRQPGREAPAASGTSDGTSDGTGIASGSRDTTVTLYYVGNGADGPRLFSERRRFTDVAGTDVEIAVQAAATLAPRDPDYYPFPRSDGSSVRVSEDGEAITVDLRDYRRPDDAGAGEEQQMALQALVWTADAAAGDARPVRFLVDGHSIDVVLSTNTTEPVQPLSAQDALANVSIDSPTQGATVDRTFTVSGRAYAFEADVVWKLEQDGRVVKEGYTTAADSSTLSPYSFEVTAPSAGTYTLVVNDTDVSDGEGFGPSEDTKEIIVR